MAWTRTAGGQVELLAGDGTSTWLAQTSLSTVNLVEADPGGGDRLRMFGIDPLVAGTIATDPFGDGQVRITYLDAVGSGSAQRFQLNQLPSDGDPSLSELKSTSIPTRKNCQEWYYTGVWLGSGPPSSGSGRILRPSVPGGQYGDTSVWWFRDRLATMDVWYKDPCVVHLGPAGNGWLMLLSRLRKIRTAADCGADNFGGTGPDETLSDIVAFWADEDDPGFEDASTVTGPYWIAPNIGALGPDVGPLRFWLSVPGGAMVDAWTLAVLFVAERTGYAEAVRSESDAATLEVAREIAWADRASATYFTSTIGVKLIDVRELAALRALRLYGNEQVWAHSSRGGDFAARGTSSPVYVWKDDGSGTPSTEILEDSLTLKLVDPQLARCSNDIGTIGFREYLRLFVATNGRSESGGFSSRIQWITDRSPLHGIWMAKPVPTGAFVLPRRSPGPWPSASRAGIDWLLMTSVPIEPAAYYSTDVPAYMNPIDPDPVRLTDGTWRVGFGEIYGDIDRSLSTLTETVRLLAETTNDDATICPGLAGASPSDAWLDPAIHSHPEWEGRFAGGLV